MARYADPTRCPDCRTPLPFDVPTCPVCALPLRGPIAVSLLDTLRRADDLLTALRASGAAASPPVTAGARTGLVAGAGGGAAGEAAPVSPATYVAFPASTPAPAVSTPRRGLRGSSVPVVLLALGALCLLVAAVIFLAVAWSWLGVAGRTAVLVALTATAGGLAVGLAARGLRVAAEALSVVALGLLLLDLAGAATAGWVAIETPGAALRWGGAATAATGAALALAARLQLPQVGAGVGIAVLGLGVLVDADRPGPVVFAAVVVSAAVALVARNRRLTTLAWVAAVGGGLWWLGLVRLGLERLDAGPTLDGWWLEAGAGELAGAAVLAALLALGTSRRDQLAPLPQIAGAVAAALGTLTVAGPALDEGADALASVAVAVVAAWAPFALVDRRRVAAWLATGPLALACLTLLPVLGDQLLAAAEGALLSAGPWSRDWTTRVEPVRPWADPLLLLPAAAALAAIAWAAARLAGRRLHWPAAATLALPAGLAMPALYPTPVAVVAALAAAVGAAAVGASLRRDDDRALMMALGGTGLVGLAAVAALSSVVLTLGAVTLVAAGAALVAWRGRFPGAEDLGGATVGPALAGLVWTIGELAGHDAAGRGVPVLVVVGLAAIAWPRPSLELGAAAAGGAGAAVAVALAGDTAWSLALHLTLAGVVVSASALVNPHRRTLGWVGGLLLAFASWVRLADLGVGTPEAYTLPGALALVAVGLVTLHRDPALPTRRALGAGLWLATLPSLLWLLDDPLSLRAVLLGAACLVLVLGGAVLRWSAPVVVGGGVGALLVLRELAPWAAQTPQWALIGAAGTALVVAGVTWEARARDLRRAAAYLGRLR